MADGGNPLDSLLAISAPNLYAQQLAIARRQALAQGLMQNGSGDAGSSPYGGLKNAGNMLLGAFLAKKADQQMGNLWSPQQQPDNTNTLASQAMQQRGVPAAQAAQVLNAPWTMPSGGQSSVGFSGGQLSPSMGPQQQQPTDTGQVTNGPNQGAPMSGPPPMAHQSQGLPQSIPAAMAGAITPLPGMNQQDSILEFVNNNAGYWKARNDANALTDQEKNIIAAYPNDPTRQAAALQGIMGKASQTRGTPGGGIFDAATGRWSTLPNQQGVQNIQGADGQWHTALIPGASEAAGQLAYAESQGKSGGAIQPIIGPDGRTIYTTGAQAAGMPPPGMGQQPNLTNNPLNMQPGGQEARYSTPTAGIGAAWDNLGTYQKQGVNSVAGVMNKWAPYSDQNGRIINPNTPQNIAMISQKLGVGPNDPINLNDPNIKGQLIDLMRPTETGTQYGSAQGQGQQPQMPPGVAPVQTPNFRGGIVGPPSGLVPLATAKAKAAGDEYTATKEMSADSPTRQNVLQEILNISKLGAPTGSPEWMNEARQTAAAIGQQLGVQVPADSPAALMGWVHKYMQQYSSRMAEGGNETDAKRVSAEMANPNLDMFPATLQRVVPWILANEKGVMAKANFYDANQSDDPNKVLSTQATWRNTYQPRVAQFEMMSPQQQQGYLSDPRAFRSAQDRQAFIQAALKLHPYFQGVPGGSN